MKFHMLIVLAFVGVSLPAEAQTSPGSAGPGSNSAGAGAKEVTPTGLGSADSFKAADTDGNGSLNREEYQRHRSSHSGAAQSATGTADVGTATKHGFESIDTNRDGKISAQEFARVGANDWQSNKGGGSSESGPKNPAIKDAQ